MDILKDPEQIGPFGDWIVDFKRNIVFFKWSTPWFAFTKLM